MASRRKRIPPYSTMTMKYLREEMNLRCDKTERWVSIGEDKREWANAESRGGKERKKVRGFRKDLFGFIDILAIDGDFTYGVQCTSAAQRTPHLYKISLSSDAALWLSNPYRKVLLVTWGKQKLKRGGKAERWVARVTEITAEIMSEALGNAGCPF